MKEWYVSVESVAVVEAETEEEAREEALLLFRQWAELGSGALELTVERDWWDDDEEE